MAMRPLGAEGAKVSFTATSMGLESPLSAKGAASPVTARTRYRYVPPYCTVLSSYFGSVTRIMFSFPGSASPTVRYTL
jgi:hypothetical protein